MTLYTSMLSIIVAFFCLLLPFKANASAFGLEKGMPILLIEENENMRENPSTGIFIVNTTPKPHPDFGRYILKLTPSQGLCKVTAVSKIYETKDNGYDLKFEMSKLDEKIVAKYGNHVAIDLINEGSTWKSQNLWTRSIIKGDREYSFNWRSGAVSLPDNIDRIVLTVKIEDSNHGRLVLEYTFDNNAYCDQEIEEINFESEISIDK
jgi:hypothetical protein